MHEEILSQQQRILWPLTDRFASVFGLVGGTAVALQIGHRRSIDFDLATTRELRGEKVKAVVRKEHKITRVIFDEASELTLIADGVKLTFFQYPFGLSFPVKTDRLIMMPDMLTLAAMKAYALGRRAKWKDYVDLYFGFKRFTLSDLVRKSKEIFAGEFSEKQFREQLAYFEDIDYSEEIDFMPGFETDDETIKNYLTEVGLSG